MRIRRAAAAVAIGAATIALASCGAPSYDVEAIDLGEPGEVTAAGTTLAFDEPAWIEADVYRGEPGDDPVTEVVGFTVRDIIEREPSVWEQFGNSEEFEGDVPWAIIVQQTFTGEPFEAESWVEGADVDTESVWPLLENGDSAELLYIEFQDDDAIQEACGISFPSYDAETNTAMRCLLAAAPEGQKVVGALYDSTSAGGLSVPTLPGQEPENPYLEQPLVWQ
ncbi:hypothetical protein [Microbacterium sediminis]|uniref:hypothetical protein n=1 Tax=Microbacterium sediminis TaxID=904291 RepID=UPI00107262A4|nr:hypothetical protein [Microbacterium sediminis]QBR74883.1 hypothetical protein E3O41_11075 [Microbacterium sediminis]